MRKKVTILLLLMLFISFILPITTPPSRKTLATNIMDTQHTLVSSDNTTTWRYVNSIEGTYSYPSQYLDVATYSLRWISGVDINSYIDREDYTSELKGSVFWTMKVDHGTAQPYSSGELYDNQYNTTFSTTENESLLMIIKTKVYMPTFTLTIKAEGMPYWYSYNWISYPAIMSTTSPYTVSHTVTNSTDYLDTEGNIYIAILVGGEMYYTGSSTTQKGYCRWYIFNRTSASWDRITDDGPWDTQSYTISSTTNYVRPISHIIFALDYFAITYPSADTFVNHYVATNDTVVIHKLEMSASIANTRLTLSSLSSDWTYWYSEPQLSYDGYRTFTFPNSGKYSVYFISYDTWNYPNYEQSRVAYLNSKGEYLDFDQFHTYTAESPSHLIRYAPDVNDEDLVAWFRFNEGTGTTTYDWKQGLEGTISGASWATGYIGKALSFDGINDYVSVSDIAGIPIGSQSRSIEVWFKPLVHNEGVLVFWGAQHANEACGLRLYNSTYYGIRWYFWGNDITVNTGNLAGKWNHLVAVYDEATNQRLIYLNGHLIGRDTPTPPNTAQLSIYIGSRVGTVEFFKGVIDEVRIWKRALTPEEVWWRYALSLYYDGQKDMLGRTSSGSVTSYTSGVFGTASEFDGVDDYVGVFNDASLQQREGFTIITYFKANSGRSISLYRWRTYGAMLRLSNGHLYFSYYDHSAKLHTLASADTYTDNEWHLIVAVKTFDEMSLYIDGDLEVNTTITGEPDIYYGSGGGAIGRDGDASSGYFEGYIDELLLLNQPISPEMAENLWKLAKTYIGGYYTDTEFKTTWQIESDSPEDGNGFSEDFSDVSEWTNIFSYQSFTTDGDVANYTIDGSQTATVWGHVDVSFSANISTSDYPFLELRYNYYEENPPDEYFYIYLMSGDSGVGQAYYDGGNNNGEWIIGRINLLEKLGDVQFDEIRVQIRAGAGDFAYVLLDWLRVYGFDGASGIAYTTDIDSDDWITSIGGILEVHSNFETTNDEFLGVKYDVPNFDGSDKICVIRFKGYIWLLFVMTTSVYEYIFNANDWSVIQIDLSDGSRTVLSGAVTTVYSYTGGSGSITEIRIGQNDISGYDSGEYYGYVDYLRIGYLDNEKIQDTSWEPLLYPIYEHPKSGYVWFNVTDIFGNSLVYEPRDYSVYQDFVLPLYSWKFKNNKDNTFIHVNISRNGFHWSEWLAPKEVARYDLYTGNYTLRITYPDNSYFETTISVTQDYYWMLSGNTLGDVLTGIDNLYYNITNVNQTLYNQIINVNISMTNWNSEINNTIVNININLDNVNSTLYNEIINIDASINNLQTNVTWQIQNLSISMNNNFTNIQTQIVTVNNTVLNVNSTLIRVNNTIINQITNLNNSMTYQFTHVITNITNVNNTLYQQTQTIKEDIVDLAHTEYRNPPPEPVKVPVVGDLVTSEAGQVIAGFGIILAIIFAFMYVVERGRRISIEEERSAKRMINALKK